MDFPRSVVNAKGVVYKVRIPRIERKEHIAALNLSDLSFAKVVKIDASVDGVYCKSKDACLRELCRQPFWRYDYGKLTICRALRAMSCEHGIAKMLQKQFDTTACIVMIALSADFMLNKPLQEADILSAACSPGKVFLTQNNDGLDGYTNVFYMGP